MVRRALLICALACAAWGTAHPAWGAYAGPSGAGGFEFRADPGENNFVEAFRSSGLFTVRDRAATVREGDGCFRSGERSVRCVGGEAVPPVLALGDRNDNARIDASLGFFSLSAGDGQDIVHTTAPGIVTGDAGHDVIAGEVTAGPVGTPAPLSCTDLAGAHEASAAVFTGHGGAGDDTLVGGVHPDVLEGQGGSDTIQGAQGADLLIGGPGRDLILGGPGNDLIAAGAQTDIVKAGPGDDQVCVFDLVRDEVLCEEGSDQVFADAVDMLDWDCERAELPAFALPRVLVHDSAPSRGALAGVVAQCQAAAGPGCLGRVFLRAHPLSGEACPTGRRPLGLGYFAIRLGERERVLIRLSRRLRLELRLGRCAKLELIAQARDSAGDREDLRAVLELRR